jgi:hypothetical protein
MPDSSLSAGQLKAIDLLLTSKTLGEVAEAVGVDGKTLYTWMRKPAFKRELRAVQKAVIRHNVRGMTTMAATAIKTLMSLMESGEGEIRFKAAQEALERLLDADLVLSSDEDGEEEEVRAEEG